MSIRNTQEDEAETKPDAQAEPIMFEEDSIFVGSDTIMAEEYAIPVDDAGKTAEQILAECGVTKEELDKTFSPDYKPLPNRPNEMSKEEFIKRVRESQARQKNKRAYSKDTAPMPSTDEINRMNSERSSGKVGFGEEGPQFSFEGFLQLLEKSKEDARRKQETALEQRIRQTIYNDMKKSLEEIVEAAELEAFDAKSAKRLFLEKAKEQSQLQNFLKSIRKYAKKGQSEMQVHYICQFDWTRLTELGFTITNLSSGGNLAYKISWYSREQNGSV